MVVKLNPTKFFSRNYPLTKFRHVTEGWGGTLHFHPPGQSSPLTKYGDDKVDLKSIQYVGTTGVRTCVGVYFAIDDQRCFLAHINAYTRFTGRVPYGDQGEYFKRKAIKELHYHAKAKGWDPDVSRSRILQSLVMVCAQPEIQVAEDRPPTKLTGWWVMEGIKAFLGAPPETPFLRKEGFVVGHHDGHRDFFTERAKWDGTDVDPPELPKYEAVEQHEHVGQWKFETPDHEHFVGM